MSHSLPVTLDTFAGPFRRFAAALLPGLVILLGAVQLANADQTITAEEAGQLIALIAGLVVTYVVPILGHGWAGLFKTGAAILAAVATLIIPLVTGFTWQALLIFAIAVLQALATEIGVQIRVPVDLREASGVPDVSSLPTTTTAALD